MFAMGSAHDAEPLDDDAASVAATAAGRRPSAAANAPKRRRPRAATLALALLAPVVLSKATGPRARKPVESPDSDTALLVPAADRG